MERFPKVGLGVLVRKNGKMLIGKRKVKNGNGMYAFPGGHLEFGETWDECAQREVMEETGLDVKIVPFLEHQWYLFVTNDILDKDRHYITIWMLADWKGGEPQNLEPHKCEGWSWMTLKDLRALIPLDGEARSWLPLDDIEPLNLGV